MNKKTIETRYRKLSEVEHVLKRTGRYLGSTEVKPVETYYITDGKVCWGELLYSPVFLKLFDEIISNSADFSKRDEGKHLTKIDVTVNRETGLITVYDNGGIPVVKHSEYNQYVPELIFSELRSGSNFDDEDDSVSTGQNGEGATLVNMYSKQFTVDTADGKNRFLCTYSDNMQHKTVPAVTKTKKSYTEISFIPDYERLSISLDDHHYAVLERRTYEIAATNPHLQVSFNGKPIKFKAFKDFAALFSDNRIDFGHERFQVSVFHSSDGFKQVGFVNSTNVHEGGTHVDYVMSQLVGEIKDYIEKKTKQDVKASDIKNHFFVMINATINNPRYNSQTKEKLQTPPRLYGTTLEIPKKVIQQIIKSDIVKEILEWAENKKMLDELAALNKKNKSISKGSSLRDITKYEPANSSNRGKCILFIAEGDSAAKTLQSARSPEFHGIFPFKGKPVNVRDMKIKDMVANVELSNLMQIIGLKFNQEPVIGELRYSKLAVTTDQDMDGDHLFALVYNMFEQLWPSLLKKGFLVKLQTPIVRVKQGKNELEFTDLNEFKAWEKVQTKPYSSHYLKGLGSNDTKYFKEYMFNDKYFTTITYEDKEDVEALSIAFDKSKADERKKYIYG